MSLLEQRAAKVLLADADISAASVPAAATACGSSWSGTCPAFTGPSSGTLPRS